MERSSGAAPPRPLGVGKLGKKPGSEPLRLEVERPGGRLAIITLAGELDLGTIPGLEGQLFDELRANDGVVVDLRRVEFIDSSGIGLLIRAHREATAGGAPLHAVISDGSQVERVFTLAGIGKALPIFLDRDEAVRALSAPG